MYGNNAKALDLFSSHKTCIQKLGGNCFKEYSFLLESCWGKDINDVNYKIFKNILFRFDKAFTVKTKCLPLII
jgi:hypothetical protein